LGGSSRSRSYAQPWLRVSGLAGADGFVSYPLPPNCEDVEILRVVVRESLSGDLTRKLIIDILNV
jgi:glutamate decarboxylase